LDPWKSIPPVIAAFRRDRFCLVNTLPHEFLGRFAAHNRSCWAAAVVSVVAAAMAWLFFFAIYSAVVLVFETVRTGSTDLLNPPWWYWPSAGCGAAVLALWGIADRWKRRYRLPPDRPIIGWHLLPEFLLLPPKLTFAIWDHVAARVSLRSWERKEAWRLLQTIFVTKRAELPQLALHFPDSRQLSRLLIGLQLTGWIDLHRGEETWFYRTVSDQEPLLRSLLAEAPEDE
jgi:hypothetical protein